MEAAGSMAKFSVNVMPVARSASSSENNVIFFGVVRRGWIAGRGTDAAIVFAQQVFDLEIFVAAEAPGVADLFVQPFG